MSAPNSRIWRTLGWSAFGLAIATAAAWVAWDRSTRRALDAATARVAAAGLPRDFAKLDEWVDRRYGPLPAEANGAPALRTALMTAQELEGEAASDWLDPDAGDLPAVDDTARAFVRDHDDFYVALAAALTRGRYRFDVRWERGLEAETPIEFGFAVAFGLLTLRVAVRIVDEDLDGALEDVRTHVALGESLREVPRPLEQMVRIARRTEADRLLRAVLLRSDDPLGALTAAGIAPVDGGIRTAIGTEASLMLHATTDLLDAGTDASFAALLLPSVRGDVAGLIDVLVASYELAVDETPDHIAQIDALEASYAERAGMIGRMMMTPSARLVREELAQRAELLVTAAGADAIAFRLRERRWPALDELGSRPRAPSSGDELAANVEGDALVLRLGEAEWRLEPGR